MQDAAHPHASDRDRDRSLGRLPKKAGWVQTDKKTHEAWARFTLKKPTASACLHFMCAWMCDQNAIVIAQSVLAKKLNVSLRTISTAISDLEAGNWIQVVKIGKGKESAYVINDRVAWDKPREKLNLSIFSAMIVADSDDQDADAINNQEPLKRLPVLYPFERQLPTGPGEPPPSQPSLPELEPDLPCIRKSESTITHEELEKRGQLRLSIDPETGEIL